MMYSIMDDRIISKGTRYYRAPELSQGIVKDPAKCDVYSAGVVLFGLKSQGLLPHLENELVMGLDLFNLLENDPKEFWKAHCKFEGLKEDHF